MKHPPVLKTRFESLPGDQPARCKFLTDAFGRYLFWALDGAKQTTRQLVESWVESEE